MKKYLLWSIIIFVGQLYSQNIIAPDTVDTNIELIADTVYLNQDMIITNGHQLEIIAGTVFIAIGNFAVYVEGSIRAIGSEQDSIFFTVSDTTGFADSAMVGGGWKGFIFDNTDVSNDSSIFEYCVMEYGKAFGDEEQERRGGFMYVSHFNKIRVSNCLVQNNFAEIEGGAFFMEYCSAKINNNRFYRNKTYHYAGAIYMCKQTEGIIDNNVFLNNVTYNRVYSYELAAWFISGAGAAVYIGTEGLENLAPTVSNNSFYNNLGPSGILYDSTVRGKLFNNVLVNNNGRPIYIGHSLSKSQVINNTIANNSISGLNNNGIEVVFSTKVLVLSNIVWNNISINSAGDTMSVPYDHLYADSIRYNLLFDSFMQGTTNITEQDPMFVNPSPGIGLDYDGEQFDWSLQDVSPAVNAGELLSFENYGLKQYDISGNERLYGGRIDLGAYENQNVFWDNLKNIKEKTSFVYIQTQH